MGLGSRSGVKGESRQARVAHDSDAHLSSNLIRIGGARLRENPGLFEKRMQSHDPDPNFWGVAGGMRLLQGARASCPHWPMRSERPGRWRPSFRIPLAGGRDAQYGPLGPCDGVSGLGKHARTTGGAGILPAAILRKVRLGWPKWTVLGETPVLQHSRDGYAPIFFSFASSFACSAPLRFASFASRWRGTGETPVLQHSRDGYAPISSSFHKT